MYLYIIHVDWFKGISNDKRFISNNLATELLSSLTPDYVSSQAPSFISKNTILESEIIMQRLEKCFKRKDTSPGFDGITYSMLNFLPENGKRILLELHNCIFRSNFIPNQWRDITIVPIPKPGRDCRLVSSLRPISMISCVCKIFYNILVKRLEWFIEKNKILANCSTGFRRNQSAFY